MKLLELIQVIECIASEQPCINMIVRDSATRLNVVKDNKYGAFVWQQGTHRATVADDMMRCNFKLFYIDRLINGSNNETEIQSVGISALNNIIRTLAEDFDVEDWTLDVFEPHKFTDLCSGAWADVTIRVPIDSPCPVMFSNYLLTAEGWKVIDSTDAYILVRQ